MKRLFTSFTFLLFLACQGKSQPDIELQVFASGFSRPVDIAHAGDDRLFIVEQHQARIWILDRDGNKLPTPFLNLGNSAISDGNEQGLLGLAFHPGYAANGYFYVNYTKPNGDTRISRFQVSADNPNVADPASETVLFEVDQPYSNHNGGGLKFGPDGYLYIGLGDGGSGGDPQANGQKRSTFLGKFLRIDVNGAAPYSIPPGNPFVNDPNTLDEIWALGLRNPWRFSFDRATGDLWIGDVGQDSWEEIDFQPASSNGGENYGWRCYEGNHTFNTGGCPPMSAITFPVAEYANAGSDCSVTGGFVYRGCNFPELYGHYLYADYCSGRIWSLTPDSTGGWNNMLLADLNSNQFVSFGENKNGELFLTGHSNGNIYRVVETALLFEYEVNLTQPACPENADGSIALTFSGNNDPVEVLWNDGSTETVRPGLPAGDYSVTITGGNGCTAVENIALQSIIQFSGEVTDASCPGDANGAIDLTLTGNVEPPAATWNDGSNDFDRTGLSAGSYTVTITTDEGCTFTETFTVETKFDNPATPVITVSQDTVLSVPAVYATYQWYLNGSLINGADEPTYIATENGDYTVQVANEEGCEAVSGPVTVSISSTGNITGVERISVTPNPFGNSFLLAITAGHAISLEVEIHDMQDKVFLKERMEKSGSFKRVFDTAALPAGVFFIKIKAVNGEEWVERLVKK